MQDTTMDESDGEDVVSPEPDMESYTEPGTSPGPDMDPNMEPDTSPELEQESEPEPEPDVVTKPFDAVLMLDVSGSMKTRDMYIQDVGEVVERMRPHLGHGSSQEFLGQFREGETVRRFDGVAMCSLLYLIEKIDRGVGDNIAVIPFSDRVHTVMFDGTPYYRSSQSKIDEASALIVSKIENMHHGLTNTALAFEEAIEISKEYDRSRPKMFILLTDGKADNEAAVLQIMEDRIMPRGDIILNAVGLGSSCNDAFLDHICRMTGGTYHAVAGLGELASIFSKYAMEFSVAGSDMGPGSDPAAIPSAAEYVIQPSAPASGEACPGCGGSLRFVKKYDSWYCVMCYKYKQEFDEEDGGG